MPRVENCGENVSQWCEETGEGSSTLDLCNFCARQLKHDPHVFGDNLQPYNGDPVGTDGWFAGVEHPSYSGEGYGCDVCGETLSGRDD